MLENREIGETISLSEDTILGDHSIAEIDMNENELGPRPQLENSVWNPEEKIFLTDYHNKVLPAWMNAEDEWFHEDSLLLHVDLHRDDTDPVNSWDDVEYAYLRRNADDFVDLVGISEIMTVAEELEMFDETYYWGGVRMDEKETVNSLDGLEPPIEEYDRLLLDVDLDFFEGLKKYPPESNYDIGEYYEAIAGLEERADMTTYATSPGFIDQQEALDHLDEIRSRHVTVSGEMF